MKNGDKRVHPISDNENYKSLGLTKREYFAAMAMHGLLSAGNISHISQFKSGEYATHPEMLAIASVSCADALLKKLEIEI